MMKILQAFACFALYINNIHCNEQGNRSQTEGSETLYLQRSATEMHFIAARHAVIVMAQRDQGHHTKSVSSFCMNYLLILTFIVQHFF